MNKNGRFKFIQRLFWSLMIFLNWNQALQTSELHNIIKNKLNIIHVINASHYLGIILRSRKKIIFKNFISYTFI